MIRGLASSRLRRDRAPYQSPTFRAIQVIAGPTDPAAGAKVIDNDNVVPLNDPNGAMRVYLRTMKAGGGR